MNKEKKQKAAKELKETAKVLDQSEIDEVVEKITGRPAADSKKTRKSSEVLSQEEIDRLLEAITNCDENYYPMTANTRKVKIYDFKRPDVFSKQEIRDISCIAENIARALNKFITSEYDISVNVHVCSVDQLMCEEFVRSVPTPAPCCSFEWMEGRGLFEMDPAVFYYCFLGASSVKKNHEPNGLEKQIFEQFIYTPIMKTVYTEFTKAVQKEFPEMTNHKYDANIQFTTSSISPTEIGILITFNVKAGKNEGLMNLFFNADCIKSFRNTKFFSTGDDNNFVPIAHRPPNTIVEVGRFRLEDDAPFKEKMIFETDKLAGLPLDVYRNNKYAGSGEAIVIDNENAAVRIVTKPENLEQKTDDGFYNTKVIFGSRITDDSFKFNEGTILELNENIADPVRIVKDGKTIGWGELVVINESFGVKVLEVIR